MKRRNKPSITQQGAESAKHTSVGPHQEQRSRRSSYTPEPATIHWGYIVYLEQLLLSYYTWIVVLILERSEEMALGLGRLWKSGVGGDAVEGEEDEIPLVKQDGAIAKTVKRRRRKDVIPGSEEFFPGMVNLSGVLCYMNSVLQSLASLASLVDHLDRIALLAVEVDLPTPVTDAMSDILNDLNTPHTRQPQPLRPHSLIQAIQALPPVRRLLSTREQQDAHELLIVLVEAISDEALKVAMEVMKNRGMADVLSLNDYVAAEPGLGGAKAPGHRGLNGEKAKRVKRRGLAQPWEGLVARRRTCRRCGWCEAIRMDTLGGMELPVPLSGDMTLNNCIAEYLSPELLSGVTCEMCSLHATIQYYQSESNRLSLPPNHPSSSPSARSPQTPSGAYAALENLPPENASSTISDKRKKKAKDARKVEARLKIMLESGTISHFGESVLPSDTNSGGLPIKWQKVNSDSVREGAITRPPQSLRLHCIRSGYTNYGQLVKKSARISFPTILDLTQFVANGVWEERTNLGELLSSAGPPKSQSGPRVLYRLESVILHYGMNHSSGHYICIRRKPRGGGDVRKPTYARKSCVDGCRCEGCLYFGQVREEEEIVPGRGWLRISDADVEEVGEEALVEARAAVFMLFYEKVEEYAKGEGKNADAIARVKVDRM